MQLVNWGHIVQVRWSHADVFHTLQFFAANIKLDR